MATKKAAAKRLKLQDLAAATGSSVKAALGKSVPKLPGTLAGFWLSDEQIGALDKPAATLAKEIAALVTKASGIKVSAATHETPGGILVGYRQPALRS